MDDKILIFTEVIMRPSYGGHLTFWELNYFCFCFDCGLTTR